jgi:RND superfamily putative drug exporter
VAADPRVESVQSLSTLARAAGVPDNQFRSITPELVAPDAARQLALARVVNLDGDNSAALITVISKYDQYDTRHQDLVRDLRSHIIPSIRQVRTYDVYVGGDAAFFLDFEAALYGHFPLVAAAVMLMNFLILMAFFRSVFLPLKAVLMNLMTIVATIGALVLVFQHGVGTNLMGFKAQGLLGSVTPAILYVILFGLSTDYEVFILSRVKEYYHALRNNEEAVATGLEHTAGVVTAAGLILVGTFGSFASAQVVTIKEIGLGLAIGVLLDSTLVRVIMLPATMRLLGQRNWWMPGWLGKLVPELREGPAAIPSGTATQQPTQMLIGGQG